MLRNLRAHLRRLTQPETVFAHCDVPCGIYDPHEALVSAMTCVRMQDLIADASKKEGGELEQRNALVRYVATKEAHAERVKHEVRILWGDYFTEDHVKEHPSLHSLVWRIMKQASKVRQSVDKSTAAALLESVNKLAEIYWATKKKEAHLVKAPYVADRPMVVPRLQ